MTRDLSRFSDLTRATLAIMIAAGLAACDSGQQPSEPNESGEPEILESASEQTTTGDPYMWLEEVEGEKALDWVRAQNERTLAVLEDDPRYEQLRERAEKIYTAQDRIAYAGFQGDFLTNFWQDDTHVRGILRTTSLDSYTSDDTQWETVLDIDALAEKEGENWVYKGRACLAPDNTRCILQLSRGGADAVVLREYDLTTKSFVEDGFYLPEAKQSIEWIDENTVMVGTPHDGGRVTSSGYAATLRLWERGQPLADAAVILEADEDEVLVAPVVSNRPEGQTVLAVKLPAFFKEEIYHVAADGTTKRLALPDDVNFQGVFHGNILAKMRTDWAAGDTTVPAGAMAALPLDGLINGTPRVAFMLAAPETGSIQSIAASADVIWLDMLDDVVGQLLTVRLSDGEWTASEVAMPTNGSLSIISVDDTSNKTFINYESHLSPDTLYLVDADTDAGPRQIKALPDRFVADGLVTEQRFATSADGTRVPYFIVRPEDMEMDGSAPTLLYGYGGFEVSLTPSYLSALPSGWLENGGVYVVANIRGGGEYGPSWHQAALKENRQRAYDDFTAVAEDLISSGVTNSDKLGIYGGSNGGLLVGVAFTQRPDLYEAVICAVPLLDMLRYHKLLAGASWMGEYGNPDVPEERAYIAEYSPYQNLEPTADYPEVFFTTSTRDDRVHPGHARKMAAKMEAHEQPFLYYENIEGGHSAAANLKQVARRDALSTVYLLQKLKD